MKLFKNAKFAAASMVIVCVLSMFVGTNKSLAAQSKKTTDMFYNGVTNEDYTQPSISSQLDKCIDYSTGLASFASNYDELGNYVTALSSARAELYYAQDVGHFSESFKAFTIAFNDLYDATKTVEMSERDREACDAYATDFKSAQQYISKLSAEYNQKVAEYNKSANAFPANLFGRLAAAPEEF